MGSMPSPMGSMPSPVGSMPSPVASMPSPRSDPRCSACCSPSATKTPAIATPTRSGRGSPRVTFVSTSTCFTSVTGRTLISRG
ncbi:MAG: hypothetical protein DMF56_17955 [Acidobacteria bacterium]|nr:MAG: hypothetical protein DMF56_17955 [Acidobacteriota bacterium]